MNIKKIDDHFSATGQIRPEDMAGLKALGFVGVVCARPDEEEPSAPDFAEIEKAAYALGMRAAHVPVCGQLGKDQITRFHEAMAEMDGPVLGYCKSGARAVLLYQTLDRA